MIPVQDYIQHFDRIWEESSSEFPEFPRSYSHDEQLERQSNFEQFQKKIGELQSGGKIRRLRNSPEKSFFPVFKDFLETVFDFETEHLNIILSDEFKDVSKDFFYKAREFGPELTPEDVYQGLRNVWIMNGIQLMMKLPVQITPSVFAYSMIYPYSDNLLDDPSISSREKAEFSERFNRRLHGEDIVPASETETQLFKLVSMFEMQYQREQFSEVYESLYAIQQGQTNSVSLLKSAGLSNQKIREICFEKGGASVLADGYLVAGKLNREQEQALFGYGVYLQLLDDIQDLKEDSGAKTKTMFSCLSGEDLGKFVNKTIHFGRVALQEMKCFDMPLTDTFLSLMNRSIETMVIESVGLNETWHSKEYLDELNRFSPLRFEFVRMKKSKSKSQRLSLFRKYFESSYSMQSKATTFSGF
jgi:hypothetical protein